MASISPMMFPPALRTLTDVTIDQGTLAPGDQIVYDGDKYTNQVQPAVIDKFADLTDVDIDQGSLAYGDQIVYDGTKYTNQVQPVVIDKFADLADVDIPAVIPGDQIIWNGSKITSAAQRKPYRRQSMAARAGVFYVTHPADPLPHFDLDLASDSDYLSDASGQLDDYAGYWHCVVEMAGYGLFHKLWAYRLSVPGGEDLQYLSATEETTLKGNILLNWPTPGVYKTSNTQKYVPPLAPNSIGAWTQPQIALATGAEAQGGWHMRLEYLLAGNLPSHLYFHWRLDEDFGGAPGLQVDVARISFRNLKGGGFITP